MAVLTSPVVFNDGVSAVGVEPGFWSRFLSAARDYQTATGKAVRITSAYRSLKEQAALHAAKPHLAAAPGRSMHNYGYALDIPGDTATAMEARGLLAKYGLHRPLMLPHVKNKEPWHIEPKGIVYDQIRKATLPGLALLAAGAGIWYLLR